MLPKKITKKILPVLAVLFITSLVAVFYSAPVEPIYIEKNQPTIKIITPPKPEITGFGLPIILKIPKLNISSSVEYIGLTSDGAMDVPKDQNNVAWLETSPRPGEMGSAVIGGHYGWKDGAPSVFDDLYKLRPGDKIYISDDFGKDTTFIVKELKRYSPGANAEKVFISDDKKSHLNLITCEGVWDDNSKSYSTRLVVFTDKE